MNVLIADDDPASRESLEEFVSDLGHTVTAVEDGREAYNAFVSGNYRMVITDIRMPKIDGLLLLKRIKESSGGSNCDVVVITGHGDIDSAITALRNGAYDFLQKPVNINELAIVIERSSEHQSLLHENRRLTNEFAESVAEATKDLRRELDEARATLLHSLGMDDVVAAAPATRELMERALKYHDHPEVPVLVEGETGTGKEVIARIVHHGRTGSALPIVDLNCSAVSAGLFESELFGYESGAFSGAAPGGAKGKLEVAGEGTVFLDEIGDLPMSLQPKLLRVLQERSFYRVGGVSKIELHARIVCATNSSLEELVGKGRFRRDLFHRLKVGYMRAPPLRERPEDISSLAKVFLLREARRKKKRFAAISEDAMRILLQHPWPGNVRELENTIERIVLETDGDVLTPEHLAVVPPVNGKTNDEQGSCPAEPVSAVPGFSKERIEGLAPSDLPEDGLSLDELASGVVKAAMAKFGGNVTKTAKYLGLSRSSLYCRLKKAGSQ